MLYNLKVIYEKYIIVTVLHNGAFGEQTASSYIALSKSHN